MLFLNVGARCLEEGGLGHIVGVFQTIDRVLQRFLVSRLTVKQSISNSSVRPLTRAAAPLLHAGAGQEIASQKVMLGFDFCSLLVYLLKYRCIFQP